MAMNKVIDIQSAIDKVKKNDTVLLGGFGNVGAPMHLLYELAKRPEIDGLTLVTEDMHNGGLSFVQGPEALLRTGQLKKIIVSFIGSHKAVESAIMEGRLELEFVPQGTLIERIRAAGAGLGGFYTPTGVGTEVEQGKETKIINGKKYLLELPLRGNVALVKAYKADPMRSCRDGVRHFCSRHSKSGLCIHRSDDGGCSYSAGAFEHFFCTKNMESASYGTRRRKIFIIIQWAGSEKSALPIHNDLLILYHFFII